MRRIILVAMCLVGVLFAHSKNPQQLEFHSFKEASNESGVNLIVQMIGNDWPSDSKSDEDAALIRVKLENIPMVDAGKVIFKTSSNGYVRVDDSRLERLNEIWLWCDPIAATYITAEYNGNATTQTISDRLKPKSVYEIVLKNNKTVSLNVETLPRDGVVVEIETGQKAVTPDQIHGVSLGKHTLKISYKGKLYVTETIDVTETNTKFGPYDLRQKKNIKFTSDPEGAIIKLYIDGKETELGKAYNDKNRRLNKDLAYGSYRVEAIISPTETDVKDFTVDENSVDEIKLEPIKKKTFQVSATYGGNPVNATLYVDGKQITPTNQASYQLTYPIGKTYEMEMFHYNNSKKRKIKVKSGMNTKQVFDISSKSSHSFAWPWERDFNPTIAGVSIGYVSKQYVTTGYGEKLKENIWGEPNKSMHGLSFGFHFTPAFQWGLGLYTGLSYELYFSSTDMSEWDPYELAIEHCLYLPVHAYYRLRLGENCHIAIHGGVGFDYAVAGTLSAPSSDSDTYSYDYYEVGYDDISVPYGDDAWPKRFNISGEIALDFRIKSVMLTALYSRGITDHKMYRYLGDEYKSKQNKLGISISWVISTGRY
ncbi:MAG: hypothetical protein IJY31_05460 [Muribaculaceae bacterium]|nr:hypothetical protein [Muribaculaceae bacterium]